MARTSKKRKLNNGSLAEISSDSFNSSSDQDASDISEAFLSEEAYTESRLSKKKMRVLEQERITRVS